MAKISMTVEKTVDVEVSLSDFTTEDLLDELVGRRALSDGAAEAILGGAKDLAISVENISGETRGDILADLMVVRRREALIALERALGSEFIGRLTL